MKQWNRLIQIFLLLSYSSTLEAMFVAPKPWRLNAIKLSCDRRFIDFDTLAVTILQPTVTTFDGTVQLLQDVTEDLLFEYNITRLDTDLRIEAGVDSVCGMIFGNGTKPFTLFAVRYPSQCPLPKGEYAVIGVNEQRDYSWNYRIDVTVTRGSWKLCEGFVEVYQNQVNQNSSNAN